MIAKIVQKVHLGLTISDAFKYKYSTKVLCESNIYPFLKQMRRTKTGRIHGTYVISLPQLCYIENYKKHIYKIRSTGGKPWTVLCHGRWTKIQERNHWSWGEKSF